MTIKQPFSSSQSKDAAKQVCVELNEIRHYLGNNVCECEFGAPAVAAIFRGWSVAGLTTPIIPWLVWRLQLMPSASRKGLRKT